MNKPIKTIAVALAAIASMSVQQTEACTRATYIGSDNTVITGRTMDWKEDLMSNIYVFPRGMQRAGYNKGNAVNWTSKYGSVIAAGYDSTGCPESSRPVDIWCICRNCSTGRLRLLIRLFSSYLIYFHCLNRHVRFGSFAFPTQLAYRFQLPSADGFFLACIRK